MRVQFTVRRLMIVVALVAMAIVAVERYRWGQKMRYRSLKYAIAADLEKGLRDFHTDMIDAPLTFQSTRDAARRKAAWHAKREALYREAVSRPWIEVPEVPDPKLD